MAETKDVHITFDMREMRSGVTEALKLIPGVTLTSVDLLSGDYVLGDGIAVERKEANDFVLSIMDSRLFGQIEQLKAEYAHPFVLIEGDIYKTNSAINPDAIDGAISYITLLSGLKIIYTKNAKHTASMMHRMALHAQHGLGYDVALRSAKPKDLKALALYALQGLPGIGATSAKVLLDHFKTPAAAFSASAEEYKDIKGIGDKTIAKIMDVLHLK